MSSFTDVLEMAKLVPWKKKMPYDLREIWWWLGLNSEPMNAEDDGEFLLTEDQKQFVLAATKCERMEDLWLGDATNQIAAVDFMDGLWDFKDLEVGDAIPDLFHWSAIGKFPGGQVLLVQNGSGAPQFMLGKLEVLKKWQELYGKGIGFHVLPSTRLMFNSSEES
jgi:hypothetical protein